MSSSLDHCYTTNFRRPVLVLGWTGYRIISTGTRLCINPPNRDAAGNVANARAGVASLRVGAKTSQQGWAEPRRSFQKGPKTKRIQKENKSKV